MKSRLKITLALATILTASLSSTDSYARESFYNLRNAPPTIIVDLTALEDLKPRQPIENEELRNSQKKSGKITAEKRHSSKPKIKPQKTTKIEQVVQPFDSSQINAEPKPVIAPTPTPTLSLPAKKPYAKPQLQEMVPPPPPFPEEGKFDDKKETKTPGNYNEPPINYPSDGISTLDSGKKQEIDRAIQKAKNQTNQPYVVPAHDSVIAPKVEAPKLQPTIPEGAPSLELPPVAPTLPSPKLEVPAAPVAKVENKLPKIEEKGDLLPPPPPLPTPSIEAPKANLTAPSAPVAPAPLVIPPLPAKAPEIKAPEIKAPEVKLPEVKAPELKAPELKAPELKAPEVKLPEVKPALPPKPGVNAKLAPVPPINDSKEIIALPPAPSADLPPPPPLPKAVEAKNAPLPSIELPKKPEPVIPEQPNTLSSEDERKFEELKQKMAEEEAKTKPAEPAKPSRDEVKAAPAAPVNSKNLPPLVITQANNPAGVANKATPGVKELPPIDSLFTKNGTAPAAAPIPTAPVVSAKTDLAKPAEKEMAMLTPPPLPAAPPAPPLAPGKPSLDVVQQQAPAVSAPTGNKSADLSIIYGEAEIDLPPTEKSNLENLVSQLSANKSAKLTVLAYASGTPEQSSQAKRTALARALEIRKYLMDRNISADKIDIRPLGNKASGGVPDRVDMILEKGNS